MVKAATGWAHCVSVTDAGALLTFGWGLHGHVNLFMSELYLEMTAICASELHFYATIASELTAGKKLISLIALALNLDEDFFEKVGAFNPLMPFLHLLHYPD
ncbi:hypothetical protein LOK49_LG08G00313 [Camellia lanceoleosa]|uniref:Uncharacterized protein n=1 Tax=Camellia lanceoleosa TaxID=1840588 RepID=A0ACC0GXN8_9ERIC|nr:hypothetical protein LOK49_LG08G00313 [Camellia lanceoleosa]